jgi:hypothetical protein
MGTLLPSPDLLVRCGAGGEVLQLPTKHSIQHTRQPRVEFHLRLQLLQRIDLALQTVSVRSFLVVKSCSTMPVPLLAYANFTPSKSA